MRTTTLGAGGPEVGVVGLGCMGMTYRYDMGATRDDATSVAVIRQALDLGVTLVDTGTPDESGNSRIVPDGRPEHVRRSIDDSLRRLGTDRVDLYQLHRVDPQVPLEETWGALAEAVAAGKARHLGLSEVSVDEIERAQAVHPVTSVQSELSLWTRDALAGVLPHCEERDIASLPFSPLGRGFLAGRPARQPGHRRPGAGDRRAGRRHPGPGGPGMAAGPGAGTWSPSPAPRPRGTWPTTPVPPPSS